MYYPSSISKTPLYKRHFPWCLLKRGFISKRYKKTISLQTPVYMSSEVTVYQSNLASKSHVSMLSSCFIYTYTHIHC